MKSIKIRTLYMIFINLIFLTGCNMSVGTLLTPSKISNQLEETNTPLPKPTIMKLTTFPTPKSTFTMIAPTTTATVNAEERNKLLFEFLKTNGGCDLPCFMGITAGETSYPDVIRIFEQNDWSIWEQEVPSGKNIEADIGNIESSLHISSWLIEREGIVKASRLSISGNEYLRFINYHSLINLLITMGLPSDVWISIPPYLKDMRFRETSFDLFVFYQGQNILLQYSGVALLKDNLYQICPPRPWVLSEDVGHNAGNVTVYIGSKNELPPYELTNLLGIDHSYSFEDKFKVKNMLNLDIENFYRVITTRKEEACFDIIESVWP